MATLPSLRPNGTNSSTNVTIVGGSTIHESLNDFDPSDNNASDTTYIYDSGTSNGDASLDLDDMPTDFAAIQSPLTVRAVTQAVNGVDDTDVLSVQIFASDGTTAYTDQVTLSQFTNGGTQDTTKAIRTASLTVNSTGLAASRTDWNGARLRMIWTYSQNMGKDNIEIRVWSLEIDGNYSQLVVSNVSASGASSTSGSATARRRLSASASGSSSSSGSASATLRSVSTITAELWENGVFVATLQSFNVDDVGEVIEFSFDASALTGIDGANVEIRFSSPDAFDVGAVEWIAEYESVGVIWPVSASGSSTTSGTATARRKLRATASGASTTAGSATARKKYLVSASGASTTSGTAAARRRLRATASGSTTSSGSAQAKRRLQATASGSSTTVGSAEAKRKIPATASGASVTAGSAQARRLLKASSSGTSSSSGSAVAILDRLAAASGGSTTAGSAAARRRLRASSSGTSTTAGSAAARRRLQATASGASTTAGTAAAGRVFPASASGSSATAGTAAAKISLRAVASGASTTTGSAVARRRLQGASSGSSSSAGSATALRLIVATASGSSTTSGEASGLLRLLASALGSSTTVGSASAVQFTLGAVKPDGILAAANLPSSGHENVRDDPDSPDTQWLNATSSGVSTSIRLSFESPGGSLLTGTDRQEFRILVRAR